MLSARAALGGVAKCTGGFNADFFGPVGGGVRVCFTQGSVWLMNVDWSEGLGEQRSRRFLVGSE